jgi:hypothetical protein
MSGLHTHGGLGPFVTESGVRTLGKRYADAAAAAAFTWGRWTFRNFYLFVGRINAECVLCIAQWSNGQYLWRCDRVIGRMFCLTKHTPSHRSAKARPCKQNERQHNNIDTRAAATNRRRQATTTPGYQRWWESAASSSATYIAIAPTAMLGWLRGAPRPETAVNAAPPDAGLWLSCLCSCLAVSDAVDRQ